MQVQRVVLSGSGVESWTVLGDDDVSVGVIDQWLGYLTDVERSPNTVKAYAHDVKDYWGVSGVSGSGLASGAVGRHRGVRGVVRGCRRRLGLGGWWCQLRIRMWARRR